MLALCWPFSFNFNGGLLERFVYTLMLTLTNKEVKYMNVTIEAHVFSNVELLEYGLR